MAQLPNSLSSNDNPPLQFESHSSIGRLERMLARLCELRDKPLTATTCRGTELDAMVVALLAYEKAKLVDDIKQTQIFSEKIDPSHLGGILKAVEGIFQTELVARASSSRGASLLVSFDRKVEMANKEFLLCRNAWDQLERAPQSDSPEYRQQLQKIACDFQQAREELADCTARQKQAAKVADSLHRIVAGAMDAGLAPRVPTIRIGCGLALVPRLVPDVVRDYRARLHKPVERGGDSAESDVDDETRFEIVVSNGLAAELRLNCDAGHYDLVVTSFNADEQTMYGEQVFAAPLEMHLLFDRQANVTERAGPVTAADDFKQLIRGKRIVLPGRSRTPSLRPRADLLTSAAEVVETDIWFEALAMIKSSPETCCIAFPQLYPSDVRSRYKSFVLQGQEFPTMQLGIMRSSAAAKRQSAIERRVTDGLFDEFKKLINELSNEQKIVPRTRVELRRTAHLTRHQAHGHHWVLGEIRDLVITPDGYLRGTHTLEPNEVWATQSFSINGHISINRQTGRRFIVWRGYEERFFDGEVAAEIYSACVSREPQASASEPMVGSWSGRTVGGAPYVGYIVLYHDTMHEQYRGQREKLIQSLSQHVREQQKSHQLQLGLPEDAQADLPFPRPSE